MAPVTVASAQAEAGRERARELFAEGLSLTAEQQFAEAALKFREAYALVPAPNIAYNLALALTEVGELTEATGLAEAVMEDASAPEYVKNFASALLVRIEAGQAHLQVSLTGERGDAQIVLDGRALSDDELGISLPVDPGAHVVNAERHGTILERQELTLEPGATVEVVLTPSTWPGATEPGPTSAPVEGSGGGVVGAWWFWTIIGVVVLAGVGVAVGVAAGGGTEGPLDGNTMPTVVRF
ncbi:MAG: hypothetical protein DRJ42_20425 [Deltaproteobacteria bacterium]|nr:MAG: hypothetical protein DRJ42_20425 [Deltaproteobacteria bacterium]